MGHQVNKNCKYYDKQNGYCKNKEVKYPWYSIGRACKLLYNEECVRQEKYTRARIAPPKGHSGALSPEPIKVEITIKREN